MTQVLDLPCNGVCAIVVTFRPAADVVDNLSKVHPQVQHLVVVDNGSSPEHISPIREASIRLGFTLIENDDNLGIAAALNVGLRWAQEHAFEWAALFDQDSTVTDGYIEALLEQYRRCPDRDRVGMISGRYMDRKTGLCLEHRLYAKDGAPLEIMTSGSMVATRILDSVGWFREDFFIDQVDHEYCFRLRARGWTALLAEKAILLHVAGEPQKHSFWGKVFQTGHHRSGRYYYITRNGVVMMLRYAWRYPKWSYYTAYGLASLPVKIMLAEEHKWEKLVNMARGLFDAVRGKMGRVVRL